MSLFSIFILEALKMTLKKCMYILRVAENKKKSEISMCRWELNDNFRNRFKFTLYICWHDFEKLTFYTQIHSWFILDNIHFRYASNKQKSKYNRLLWRATTSNAFFTLFLLFLANFCSLFVCNLPNFIWY